MTAELLKGVRLLFLGVASVLILASITFENPRMKTLTKSSAAPTVDPLFHLRPGIFHPLTEEYVRQRAKEIPYDLMGPDAFSAPKTSDVFMSQTPLELALLPYEAIPRKRVSRKLMIDHSDETWKPLELDEYEARERKLAERAVEMGAELADSLAMPSFADGILWTTRRFNATHDYLAEQYRLHFDVSTDDATVTYKVKY